MLQKVLCNHFLAAKMRPLARAGELLPLGQKYDSIHFIDLLWQKHL
jgi:hypothetical protein